MRITHVTVGRCSPRRLFACAWLIFATFFATNVVREHYPAFGLIEQGSFRVDRYVGYHSDIFVHRDGHAYIGNNVATSVVAAVPLGICRPILEHLEARGREQPAQTDKGESEFRSAYPLRRQMFAKARQDGVHLRLGGAVAITSLALMAPLSAFLVVGMFRILSNRGVQAGPAAWLALLFTLGTPLCFRTAHLNNNMFVMYAAFTSFCLLWRPWGESAPSSAALRAAAGFFGGFCLAADYSGMIPLGCLFLYCVAKSARTGSMSQSLRESAWFVAGSVPPVLFLLYSQWAMYGNPFFPGQYWMPDVNYTDRGWRGFSLPAWDLFWLNLLHPSYGLFAFAPLLALAFLPLPKRHEAHRILPKSERRFVVAFTALFLLFCAANQYSRMQWNSGFRYLLPLVPFLFLLVADTLLAMPRRAAIMLGIGAAIHGLVLCMARDCIPPGDSWRTSPDFPTWLSSIGDETVFASYAKIAREGPQLPWLNVLRQFAPVGGSILASSWLPMAILGAVAMALAVIWNWPLRFGSSWKFATEPVADSESSRGV